MNLIETLLKAPRDSYPQLDSDELATLRAYLRSPSTRPSLVDHRDQTEALHDREFLEGTLEYNRKRRRGRVSAPKPKGRGRSKKQDVKVKTLAAITYKAEHPTATEKECADAAGMSQTTLNQQAYWQEMAPKIEKAATSGKLSEIKAQVDKRTGELVAYEPENEADP